MPDFRVADTAPEHPKLRAAGLAAAGLWAMAGGYAMRELTDGWVPDYWVATWPGGKVAARKLIEFGLWIKEQRHGIAGYRFRDWLDYQRSATSIAEAKDQTRERTRRYRESRKTNTVATSNVTRDATSNVTRDATSNVTRDVTGDDERPSRTNERVSHVTPSPSPSPSPKKPAGRVSKSGPDRAREAVGPPHSLRANQLVNAWAETCDPRPAAKLRGQLAAEIDGLLAVDWTDEQITGAVHLWASKSLGPGALASVAHEWANPRRAGPRTAPGNATDDNIRRLFAGIQTSPTAIEGAS